MALPRSLSGKLVLTVSILVVVCCLSLAALMTYTYSQQLLRVAQAEAERLAHQLALESADKVLTNDIVALQKMIDYHMGIHPALAYVFVHQGGVLQVHSFKDGFPEDLMTANALRDSGGFQVIAIKTSAGERFLDIAWPILDAQGGTLRLGISEAPYHLNIQNLVQSVVALSLGVLLIGVLVARYLVGRLTEPLSRLVDAAESIGEGRMDIAVSVGSDDEVKRLVTAFNAMVQRLKEYTLRLEGRNADINRAHLQTRESFSILQQIGSQGNLQDVCRYLIGRFKGVVACRRMALQIILESACELQVITDAAVETLNGKVFAVTREALAGVDGVSHVKRQYLSGAALPEGFEGSRRLVVIPISHEQQLLGALLIGCEESCACDRKGLDVIDLIFRQIAGSIQRAVLQETELRELQHRLDNTAGFSGIIGKDARMRDIFKLIEDTGPTEATVLIQGESGTGKELVARAVHHHSGRRQGPFVVINCSALPSTLLESELFGYEKGAFTGAHRRKIGRFEQARGGTVFLDEIGEISLAAQVKMLRVLQSRAFERIGGEQTVPANVRIVAATNATLIEAVRDGRFREDLYYRLNVIPIQLPPLRERKNDIPLLARHFLSAFAAEQGKPVNDISPEAMRRLMAYQWPGNVRELENTMEHSVVLAKGWTVEATDLPVEVLQGADQQDTRQAGTKTAHASIAANERTLLEAALQEAGWNKKLAAQRLGISRSTLYNKIKKFRIEDKPTVH